MTDDIGPWRTFVAACRTGDLPFRLEVRERDGRAALAVSLGVPDKDDGHPTRTGTTVELPPFPTGDLHPSVIAARAGDIVYAAVERVWLHELREHWSVGGRRSRDPHLGTGDGVGIVPFVRPEFEDERWFYRRDGAWTCEEKR